MTQLVLSLFPGIGLLDMAFEAEGFCVVRGPDLLWGGDVRAFHPPTGRFDGVIGGPPCQMFSTLGRRFNGRRKKTAQNLIPEFSRIIRETRPRWFVMENVEQIKKSHILQDVIAQFTKADYGLTSTILDASFCGVPQARTRFFLIGHLCGKHNELTGIIRRGLTKKQMTVRDYLGDSLGINNYYRHPRNYNRRAIFSIDEPSPTVRGVNRPVPPNYQLNSCDPEGVDLKKIRPLTTIERSLLQTFPKTFKFSGTKTNLEQMIGNAVPVQLATFVARSIKEFCEQGEVQDQLHLFELEPNFEMPSGPLHRE